MGAVGKRSSNKEEEEEKLQLFCPRNLWKAKSRERESAHLLACELKGTRVRFSFFLVRDIAKRYK